MSFNARIQFLILSLLCIGAFFINLGTGFPDIMESRNFISAREMVEHGNWWFTTMNLEPRLEKPPLPTWLTAISAMIYGSFDSLFVLRLPSALIASLMVYFMYRFTQSISRAKYLPFISASVLATSLLIIQQARTNSWDIYPHVFLLGSVWQMLVVFEKNSKKALFFSTILMAASVLSKGPVGLYAFWLPFVLAFGFSEHGAKLKENKYKILLLLVVGLLLGFSWRLGVTFNQPEVSEHVINKELTAWGGRHVRPFYFYLHFFLYIGIWVIFLLASFFYRYAKPRIDQNAKQYRFILLWIVFSFILLSVVPTKKERYLLPMLVPMALMVAYLLNGIYVKMKQASLSKLDRLVMGMHTFLVYPIALLAPFILLIQDVYPYNTLTLIALFLISLLGFVGLWSWKKNSLSGSFFVTLGLVLVFCVGVLPQSTEWSYDNYDRVSLDSIRHDPRIEQETIYMYYEQADPRVVWLIGKAIQRPSEQLFKEPAEYPFVYASLQEGLADVQKKALSNARVEQLGTFDFFPNEVSWKLNVYYLEAPAP